MKLYTDKSVLIRTLRPLGSVTMRSSTAPALGMCRLDAVEGSAGDVATLTVSATDHETDMWTTSTANVEQPGSVSVDHARLLAMVGSLPDGTVSLATSGRGLTISGGSATFTLPIDEDGHPIAAPAVPESLFHFEPGELGAMLGRVLPCVSTDDARYGINGVHMERSDDGLVVVGTDGHRLVRTGGGAGDVDIPQRVLLPRRAAAALAKLPGPTSLGFDEGKAIVSWGDGTLRCTLLDGEFPDYAALIPDSPKVQARVDREALVAASKRARLLEGSHQLATRIDVKDDALGFFTSNDGRGASDTVPADVDGEPLSIGMRATYLLDAAEAFDGDALDIGLTEDLGPVKITAEDSPTVVILMPMRLD